MTEKAAAGRTSQLHGMKRGDTVPSKNNGEQETSEQCPPEYRQGLVLLEQKAQESYDSTVVALSGGALAISFAFVENFVKPASAVRTGLLYSAWICWAASLFVVLVSHYTSHIALQRAIDQVDQGTIYTKKPGGFADCLTKICNPLGGALFFIGLVLVVLFVNANLGG